MPEKLILNLIYIAFVFGAIPAYADCSHGAPGDSKEIGVTVKACRRISPETDASLRVKAGKMFEKQIFNQIFTGAIVEDEQGRQWLYPSTSLNPCLTFPLSTTVKKIEYRACCDTGSWGKCALGGRFLGDIGGPPVDAFQ